VTIKRYLSDPALSGTVTVVELIHGERPVVRLAETWFHPQGGGQKADRGLIGDVPVVHVSHNEGQVDHVVTHLAGLEVGETYPFSIDAEWRRLNAAYHTAGHLIGSLVETQGGLRAVAGHQWPGEARVEFEGEFEDLAALQARLEQDLAAALAGGAVEAVGDPETSRAIRIGDHPPIPCGGTHVSDLGEIGPVRIEAVKRKGGRVRVSYSLGA
jgi:Ser-tRNA(Ala) deacylase AlaX